MNNNVKEVLYNALLELRENQFEEFKWRLECINYNRMQNIHKAFLEKANQQTVVDLMIQYYEEDAPDVFIHVLQKSNINDIAKKLEETLLKDVDAHQFPDSSDYRNYIKNLFATIKDPNAVPGEYVPLNQRYSNLIIVDYHPSKKEREDEILAMGRKHLEIISKRAESSTSIEALFNPDKNGFIPQVVVLEGAAGFGKTITAQKIIFDWASQLLYQDKFDYAFYISCREMNLHAESQKTSIAEMISNEWLKRHEVNNVIRNILKDEEKLLFIIDGFDELRYSSDQPENCFCTDPWQKEPVRILLISLFRKKLLPKSSLIITTRPTALEKLHQYLKCPRNVKILGFSAKERQEYFYNFFENGDQATQALRFVKQNDTLFTMCVIPLVSWIICTVMKQEMESGKDLQKTPYTLTAIYMMYLSSLLKFHHKEAKQDVQSNVKGLCFLAAEGVRKQKTLFMEEEVTLHQRDFLSLFLNESIFKRGIGCIKTYSFVHLSFQEFFAALFYIREPHSENWNKNLQMLLKRDKSFRPDFAVGFRFLFGFLNEEKRMREELKKEFGWEISPKIKESLLDFVKDSIPKRGSNFQLQKEMLSYLYEIQDDNFIKNAVDGITEIDYQCNSDMELMILGCCVQHCQNLKYFSVEGSAFVNHAETETWVINKEWSLDETYMEDFFQALTKLRNLSTLRFIGWSFTESCSRHLTEVFKKNQKLKELQLFLEDTDEKAVELLCEGLQHQVCKLEILR
ncbi:NACHT, LRR and PYD domains-containing protein 12-like [Notechis scutatus]|uniref:NACHT, LRR and PYD domains-containing protein 12-like n=1 Tax=Notechis scutatus TaxID=8663 RepID=A0A6J1VZQ7_9SAUR|nr:NACHT, LRR and PYD domains-containing protein 12-like [Notechis scutatus]